MRLLGGPAGAEHLRVFQQVVEVMLRRPLKPTEIRDLVGALDFQVEFVTGREFGVRVRGQGIALLDRARRVLAQLAQSGQTPAQPAPAVSVPGAHGGS
jgi:hypothetical protein